MERIVIIADDLTGACDTGIQFRNYGWETSVLVSPESCQRLATIDAPVVSVNTDTRSVSPEAARETVAAALKALRSQAAGFYYKKVDSVLRGSIAAELEACFDALGAEFALIAPAFPEAHRRVRDGRLYIGAGDAPEPMVDARGPVTAGSNRICRRLSLETIRSGLNAVVEEVQRLKDQGATLILADSWCSKDLHTVARAVLHFGSRCIPVGSAGLASHLAELLAEERKPLLPPPCRQGLPGGPLLVAVGTRHPVTVEQVQRLKAEEELDTCLLAVDGITRENAAQRAAALWPEGNAPSGARGILLTTDFIYHNREVSRHLLRQNAYNPAILEGISLGAERLLSAVPIRGLIASGGDVSSQILGRLHLDRIDLMDEPTPGVVIGLASGEKGRRVLLATKSGGFGSPDALLELYRYMNTM